MSLTGAKSISTLATPPKGRVPIHTMIAEYSLDVIKDAIQKELDRNGQVYFLHNHIDELPLIESKIKHLFPEISIGIAHGKMKPSELEKVMVRFMTEPMICYYVQPLLKMD